MENNIQIYISISRQKGTIWVQKLKHEAIMKKIAYKKIAYKKNN